MENVTEEIRARADLYEVVSSYVPLRPAGTDRWKGCCPFHDEKTPSFNVSRDKGFFKCFGCLDANELIWTRHGLKAIGAVRAGETIWDGKGGWSTVFATNAKQSEFWEIETGAFRHDALRLTPDHTCLVVREAEAVWALPFLYNSTGRGTRFKNAYRRYKAKSLGVSQVRADEVQPGDFWLFPVISDQERCNEPLTDVEVLAPYVGGKRVPRVTSLPVHEEVAFLYGLYLVDGSTNLRSVRWTFHHDEKSLAAEVDHLLRKYFGLKCSHFPLPQRNTREVVCSKTDLARQFERWFGKGAAQKRLPAEALTWPVAVQRALIQGYLSGDGNKFGHAHTVSRQLAYGLFALGIQCGLSSSLGAYDGYTSAKGQTHQPYWHWSARQQQGLNGFFHPIDGILYYWSRVTRSEAGEGVGAVVDISVPGPDSFVTKLGATHNCGKSGDVFKFVQEIENVSFPEARRMLAERYGIAIKAARDLTPEQKANYEERDRLHKVMAAAAAYFREQFWGNAGSGARDYALRTRGLSRQTCETFGVGYALDGWDGLRNHLTKKYGFSEDDCAQAGLIVERKSQEAQLGGMFEATGNRHYYDRFRHRLMFPIWDERGRCIAFGGRALEGGRTGNPDAKYLNSPEGKLFHKSQTLYAFHLARAEAGKRESIVVCEGYMDAIALHEHGFTHAVASLGTALTVQHVGLLKRLSPKRIYLCYDGDGPGMAAALRAAPLFSSHGLDTRVITLPDGDDPDTFLRKNPPAQFERALTNAKFLGQFRLERAVAPHDLSTLAGRMEAVRAGADVVAHTQDATERSSYTQWLVEEWKAAEGLTDATRILAAEAAVRREVEAAAKNARSQQRSNGYRPDNGGASGRTSTSDGGSHPNGSASAQSGPHEAQTASDDPESLDAVTETVSRVASGQQSPGVFKAEQGLVAALIGSPSWRANILELLPPEQWTRAEHCEIALALRDQPPESPLDVPVLLEQLSPEAAGIMGELLLSDEAQYPASDVVIRDYAARVRGYWARQIETEMLEYFKLKLQRGEEISEEDHAKLRQALEATGRISKAVAA